MGKGRKSLALLLILALLASLLTGCAVTTGGGSHSGGRARRGPGGGAGHRNRGPGWGRQLYHQGGRPCLSHRLRPPARELHHQERSPRCRLGGWQPGALLPRQVHRGRPLRQPGGPAALRQGPGLDRVRHQHPGQKVPGGRAPGLLQRRPDLLYRGPLREL